LAFTPAEQGSTSTPNPAIDDFNKRIESTSLTERLGDQAFRDRARALDALLRGIDDEGIRVEGKLLGDGVLARFSSARHAIGTAQRCHQASASCDLRLHLGIHAGDVIREADNVYGGTVNIAARIAAASRPGEILVSQTVCDLARTSAGVTFEDRGRRRFKGVEGQQRVYAIRAEPPAEEPATPI
jgi:class 3 adenylate cyclase